MWRLLLLLIPVIAHAEPTRCDPKYTIKPAYPMYAEAMRIKDSLATVGVTVECIGHSKLVDIFEQQITALSFLTKQGDFDVVIVSEPYSFEATEVVEEKQNG